MGRAPATSLSALSVSFVASATRTRVLLRSVVALAPSALSTDAIAGRVRCCDIISATVLLPAAACSYSSRAAERSASREARICDADRPRRYRSRESVSETSPSISPCMRAALF